ncbi:chemotaxis protein CheW [Acinetobacter sp. MD2(2019)]|uniref:chemotaxis protein CheW n=1 Tax=Acinetobacter sp. MD2(2019) TaxID=2605273 RepID=UPI002D1EFC50|nr:chemotaxis protein CheW [Acinetobacter sp. MD2(2019)]MEB3754850.1 purine-binding chemotaxis protein CheW [Acinetobacter sp. MD2(2019)]
MAAKGFIELLRLAKRGNKTYASTETEVTRWSGIAFEMMGQYFVAPLGEVSEVIYYPRMTAIPNSQAWLKGLANIRGRLLSVTDLPEFFSGTTHQNPSQQKVLCISHQDQYMGLAVDQVLGIQHFNKKSFFATNEALDQKLQKYCQGYFHQHQRHWNVFLVSRMLKDTTYMNAASY